MKKFAAISIFTCIVLCLAACIDNPVVTTPSVTQGPQTTQPSLEPTAPTIETTEPTMPATRPTGPEPTEPLTEPTEPPTEPTEPPTEPTEPPTEPTEPSTEPTKPGTSLNYNALVEKYTGMWYLEGYVNVFLDIFQDSNGWLLIYTNNFFLPDTNHGREDGIVYPFLSGLTTEEYCIGSSFPPSSAWKEHASNTRMVFDEGCIYAGSYKFVRTPGATEIIFCISHEMDSPTCTTPSTCSKCGYTEGVPVDCQFVNGYCWFCGKKADEPITEPTEPPTEPVEPPTEPVEPPTEPVVPPTEPTEPPTEPEYPGINIITGTETISDTLIEGDIYITYTGILTLTNVKVNGNVYCYGQLITQNCTIVDLYAYCFNGWMLCSAFDGVHGSVISNGNLEAKNIYIKDDALDYAFAMWGSPTVPPAGPVSPPTEPTEPHPGPEYPGVKVVAGTETVSDTLIEGDIYITSTGMLTLTNVTVSGNVYCYGQLTIQDCTIRGLYAYNYNGFMGCASFDGVHGKVTGRGNNNIENGKFTDNSLDYAFATWGKM